MTASINSITNIALVAMFNMKYSPTRVTATIMISMKGNTSSDTPRILGSCRTHFTRLIAYNLEVVIILYIPPTTRKTISTIEMFITPAL